MISNKLREWNSCFWTSIFSNMSEQIKEYKYQWSTKIDIYWLQIVRQWFVKAQQ